MKRQLSMVSGNRLTITPRRSKRTKSSKNSRRKSEVDIPIDLFYEIFSRLSAKSIARCRCVSKSWASMLCHPDFTDFFLTKSCARPRILFVCHKNNEVFFFSSCQHLNEKSSPLVATYHTKFIYDGYSEVCSVPGWVSFTYPRRLKVSNGKTVLPVICNPTTGQSYSLPYLPRVNSFATKKQRKRRSFFSLPTRKTSNETVYHRFFGYDPINKEYKLLSVRCPVAGRVENQVLTLGAQNQSWRTVSCHTSNKPISSSGICINGVLYYVAQVNRSPRDPIIVCFDVRSEKFRFIKRDKAMALLTYSMLINYKGRLGAIMLDVLGVTRETKSIKMWVLEDAEKHEWSKHVNKMPSIWKKGAPHARLFFAGVTGTNEIVMSSGILSDHFSVFYYNIETKTMRAVKIQGMDAFKDCDVNIFVNHVEDVKLLHM